MASSSNLFIEKSAPAAANAGETINYQLRYGNAGPNDATSVVITDTLPNDVTFDDANSSPACDVSSGVVACTDNAVAAGASNEFIVAVKLGQSTANTTVSNTASIDGDEFDPSPSNNQSTDTTAVGTLADLAINKNAPANVATGGTINYDLLVENNGPSIASNVRIEDRLPNGVTFVSATPDAGSCNQSSGVVSCDLGAISPGVATDVAIVVTARTSGTKVNTANVSASTTDPEANNDSDSATTEVAPLVDLAITKTAPATVDAGGFITYTLGVTNNGPDSATGVIVEDTLPAGTQLVSTDGAPCAYTPPTVTCDLAGVANGATETVEIVVVTDLDRAGTTLTNTASVGGNEADSDSANNTDSAKTTVDVAADLAIDKSVNQAAAGGDATYTIVVTNTGPNTAEEVTVRDSLPAGVSFRSATSSQGDCDNFASTKRCDVGFLNPGASAQISIVVRVDNDQEGNTITNTSSVDGSLDDPNEDNNTDSASFVALGADARKVDLDVEKTLITESPRLGRPVEYRILVTNRGPDRATDIVVTDSMNRDIEVISTDASEGTCTSRDGVITCMGAGLEVGEDLTITVVVRPLRTGELTNTASATARGAEQAQADNADAVRAQIVTSAAARYSVKLTANDKTLKRGRKVKFTIRVRVTGGALQDLKVCDRLPRGFAYLKFRGGKLKKGQVCFTRKLARVGTYTYRITSRVGARAKRRVTNTAVADVDARAAKRSSVRLQVRGASDRAGGVTG